MNSVPRESARSRVGILRWSLLLLLACLSGCAISGCMLFSNMPPVALIQLSIASGPAPLYVQLDGAGSDDPDGAIVQYLWSFGDGTDGTGLYAEHAYPVPGQYTVSLTVKDNDGKTSTSETAVVVRTPNLPPIAAIYVSPSVAVAGESIVFDASASYDPDGQIASYGWEFGDGADATGAVVEHAYGNPGKYAVRLTVIDDEGTGTQSERTIQIVADEQPPLPSIEASSTQVEVDELVRFDATASFDPDGVILQYEWDFGDGATSAGDATAHAYSTSGSYRVRLTVTDDDGQQQSLDVLVQVGTTASDPPEATGKTYSRSFRWSYGGTTRSLTIKIPEALYEAYRAVPRDPASSRDYDEYVLDRDDDALLESLVDKLTVGTSYQATVENMLAFVQSCIEYTPDPGPWDYPRFPIETLVDKAGDCEDTAILYASLIRTMGYGSLLTAVDTDHDGEADHMAVFVPVASCFLKAHPERPIWQIGGRPHAFAETALSQGTLPLGIDPWGLADEDIQRIWDVSSLTARLEALRLNP